MLNRSFEVVKKKIIDKIYFVLLLTAIVSSSYAVLRDIASKNQIYCADVDIELIEDNSTADSNDIGLDQVNESLIEKISLFSFSQFSATVNTYYYLQNANEIYLGRKTSPP